MRHATTIAIVLVWLGMTALLVQKHAAPPATELTALPAAAGEEPVAGEEWFGVYQGGRKIGHTRRAIVPSENGRRFQDDSNIVIAMLGTPQRITTALIADVDADDALRRFRFVLTSPAATFMATGESDGRRLAVRYGTAGRTESREIPLDEPIRLPASMRPRIAAARPAAGTRYTHAIFSPLTLRNEHVVTEVEGPETIDGQETLRVREDNQGTAAHVWLTADGRVLREEAALGLELRAEPRAIALAGDGQGGAPFDLTAATRIPLTGDIDDARERAVLTLRVSGEGAAGIPNDPPRQRMQDGRLRIVRELPPDPVAAAGGELPARWVAPSPFIESDDPAVIARAEAIVGGDQDPVRKAGKLLAWVHDNMTQEPTMTVPSAREVLRARRGDCNEHAVLLAALARAAGIPARVVAGAVHMDGGFLYHAWNELWLGRWVTADAVFDQMPADATHVKLLEGGPERHLELTQVVGRLAFAVVPEQGS